MVTKKLNKLLKIRDNFFAITIISCAIYIILFLLLLLLSTPHPIFTFLAIVSVAPGCWLFVKALFKYKAQLESNINSQLTKIIKQEFQKEFEEQKIDCSFYIKAIKFDCGNIATDFHFCYFDPDVKLYKTVLFTIPKVQRWINALLPDLHHIDIFPNDDPSWQSHIVV